MNRSPIASVPPRARDERGVALLVVIALTAIVGVMIVTLVAVAIHESNASGRDRQRSGAVMAAEGRVDQIVAQIQSAPTATLPCGALIAPPVSVGSDVMSITDTISYYTADGVAISCAELPLAEVATVAITSTSRSNRIAGQAPAVRTVETLLRLTPTYSNVLSKAVFGEASISLVNQSTLRARPGRLDADVYSNGDLECGNNQSIEGSIFAQGSVSLSNTCAVSVDVWARTGFQATNPRVSVGGGVFVSSGNISLGGSSLGQKARASGTVAGTACATPGKCVGAQTVDPPPVLPLPHYVWNGTTSAAWVAQGYGIVEFGPGHLACGMTGKVDNVARYVHDHIATMSKTVNYADCPGQPVQDKGLDVTLHADLAIFATGGFSLSSMNIGADTTTGRSLYLVQPYDSVPTHPCDASGIVLDNLVRIEATIVSALYSPCNIDKSNNTTFVGQIYSGGNVTFGNLGSMEFGPLPWFGLEVPLQPVEFYSADILYKRETTS